MNRHTIQIELPDDVAISRIFGALRFDGYSVRCTGAASYAVWKPAARRPVASVYPITPRSPEAA